jgi:hypothetical protein
VSWGCPGAPAPCLPGKGPAWRERHRIDRATQGVPTSSRFGQALLSQISTPVDVTSPISVMGWKLSSTPLSRFPDRIVGGDSGPWDGCRCSRLQVGLLVQVVRLAIEIETLEILVIDPIQVVIFHARHTPRPGGVVLLPNGQLQYDLEER